MIRCCSMKILVSEILGVFLYYKYHGKEHKLGGVVGQVLQYFVLFYWILSTKTNSLLKLFYCLQSNLNQTHLASGCWEAHYIPNLWTYTWNLGCLFLLDFLSNEIL